MDTFSEALELLELGIYSLPCQPNSKYLLRGISPRYYLENPPDIGNYLDWFNQTRNNLAILTGNDLTVLDFDSLPDFILWQDTIKTRIVESRRGFHAYFWIDAPINHTSELCEIKHDGMPVVAPPSVVDGYQYQVVDNSPIARIERLEEVLPDAVIIAEEKEKPHDAPVLAAVLSSPSSALGGTLISRVRASLPLQVYLSNYQPRATGTPRFLICHCPAHQDNSPSLSIDTVNGLAKCRSPKCVLSKRLYDVVGVHGALNNLSNGQAAKQLAETLGF